MEVVDPATRVVYVVVEKRTHERHLDLIRKLDDRAAIAEGLAELEAGEGRPLAEVMAELRAEFGVAP